MRIKNFFRSLFGVRGYPRTPKGLTMTISSVGNEGPARDEPLSHEEAGYNLTGPSNITFLGCGHVSQLGVLNFYGRVLRLNLPEGHFQELKGECLPCSFNRFKEHVIRCCLCGTGIVPGDPVALYHKDNEGIRKDATVVNDSIVGCMAWSCCPTPRPVWGHSSNGVL
jgi:hypothetical protein